MRPPMRNFLDFERPVAELELKIGMCAFAKQVRKFWVSSVVTGL